MGILKQKVLYSVKKAWFFALQARSYRIQNNLFIGYLYRSKIRFNLV